METPKTRPRLTLEEESELVTIECETTAKSEKLAVCINLFASPLTASEFTAISVTTEPLVTLFTRELAWKS